MSKYLSVKEISQLKEDYGEIIKILKSRNYDFEKLPKIREAIKDTGEACAISYPTQGILKYHGFADFRNRIAYFPSISFNNDCAFTISYMKFDKSLESDIAYLNGKKMTGTNLERVTYTLDYIRNFSKIYSKAILISRNFTNLNEPFTEGKGLGTSSSGASALALSAISIIYDNNPLYLNNNRLLSIFSRYFSGSGSRSAAGGISIWMSYPEIDPLRSYAIRLDRNEHQSFLNDISILTIPIKSNLKTTQAHKIAPKSLFFPIWIRERKNMIKEFLNALESKDLKGIGGIAELDTLILHSIGMTVPNNQSIIGWEPVTLQIIKEINRLKAEGYFIYYSIDTGPSVVLLVKNKVKDTIINRLNSINNGLTILTGKIAGPPKLLDNNSKERQLLSKDIERYCR